MRAMVVPLGNDGSGKHYSDTLWPTLPPTQVAADLTGPKGESHAANQQISK